MSVEDMEIQMKVLIVGNGAVGKSSMLQRYCKGEYTTDYKKTIGVDFLERKITIGAEEVRLQIWDTAGQEEFDAMTKAYYRGAVACIVAFSTTDRESFEAVQKWIDKVEEECGTIPMVLVQNKIDLIDRAVMTTEEADALASKVRLELYRTSVLENHKVDEVFFYLAEERLKRVDQEMQEKAAQKQTKKYAKPAATSKPHFNAVQLADEDGSGRLRSRGNKKKGGFLSQCNIL